MKLKNIIKSTLAVTLLIFVIGSSSCKKDTNSVEPIQQTTNIKELQAAPTFNWATEKDVTLNVTGLPINFDVERKLVINGTDGAQYFNLFHNMKNDLTTNFKIPSHVEKVSVEFGSIIKEITLVGNVINFSFAQDIPNDLD